MKRLTLTIQIAVCLIFLIAANSMGKKEIDYREMSEDIEIMSRILDKKLKDEFEDEYRTGRFRYFFGDTSTFNIFKGLTKCRGTYLPDFGVVFTTDIEFPVAKIEQKEQKTQAEEPSLWKQMEDEIKNQSTSQRKAVVVGKSKPYEKEKVEKLKELILSTISEYAPNIAQLNSDDRIAIVVYGDYSVESRDMFGNALLQYNIMTKAQSGTSENLELDEPKESEIEEKSEIESEAEGVNTLPPEVRIQAEKIIKEQIDKDKLTKELDKLKDKRTRIVSRSRSTDLTCSDQCGTVLVISVARKYIEDEGQLRKNATILQY